MKEIKITVRSLIDDELTAIEYLHRDELLELGRKNGIRESVIERYTRKFLFETDSPYIKLNRRKLPLKEKEEWVWLAKAGRTKFYEKKRKQPQKV